MEQLKRIIGSERSLDEVARLVYFSISELEPPVVGAVHVTCADESESECVQAFQLGFVQYLLPSLKFARQSPFRIANLGGRYEWGAIGIAENHFATRESERSYKVIVVKLNSHVATNQIDGQRTFGSLARYGADSVYCGALHALLDDPDVPALHDLAEAFASEGKDRLNTLRDERQIAPGLSSLFAALTSARLQARRVIVDIQESQPKSPTLYFVIPCVTLNHDGRDSEVVCGFYRADQRNDRLVVEYTGLGDEPAEYKLEVDKGRITVGDHHVGVDRQARNHRELVNETWRRRQRRHQVQDDRIQRIRQDVARNRHRDHHHGRLLLRSLLAVLAEVAPVPAAVLLFAHGVASAHHLYRAHRLANELAASQDARVILDDIHGSIDNLPPEQAAKLVEVLLDEYSS